jgi:NADPH:quinone reductase-like Zn-dependent oxidoreductase
MKAVIYKAYGSPAVLQCVEVEKPVPASHEVLIQIQATSTTHADCYMRRGDTLFSRLVLGWFKPRKQYQVLGTEFSGIIASVGKLVQEWKAGDEVYGFRGFGTGCYAEYKAMKASGSLALKPANLTFEEAASMVDGATTALFFLKEKANVQPGQKVLINGASGSIGMFAVQLAKHLGAEVTGVCSTRNLEFVKSLGADKVIDYTQAEFTKAGEQYHVIFDTVSKSAFRQCKGVLTPRGIYMATEFSLGAVLQSLWTKWIGKKRSLFAMSVNKKTALEYIKQLTEAGQLRTYIDRQYTMEQISDAHAYVETGRKRGNVVIIGVRGAASRHGLDL